jgi:ElaB/YqjD/DUF883 family membrane-anchored ribosome-binding protein
MKLIRTFLTLVALGVAAASLSAQTAGTGSTNATPPPRPDAALGPALKAIVDANRAAIGSLLDQRKALLEQLKNATPEQRDAIRKQLQDVMKDTQAAQRDLAKAIRDAIKARRDAAKPAAPSGG